MKDQHFTNLSDRFCDRIYGTDKGAIRLELVWESMLKYLPINPQEPCQTSKNSTVLEILDMGGGAGHIALLLCELGHRVVLVEPASEMVALAQERLAPYLESGQAVVLQGSIQDNVLNDYGRLKQDRTPQFDLVLCHAVIEWLADPAAAVRQLASWIKPQGYLSLLYYNRNSLLVKNLLRGNFYRVKRALLQSQWGGEPGSLTPISPINPAEVALWLQSVGLNLMLTVGIRSFYDYMPKNIKENRDRADVLELERLLGEQEPFLSMSRYLHAIVKKHD